MHGSMWRELETEAPGNGHRSEAACQGKPGEKWLRDLTSDNATAPAPLCQDQVRHQGQQLLVELEG